MWTFLFLYILARNFCQTAGDGNSTQMLYAKLIIDKNAIPNITALLQPFVKNTTFYVETPVMTTKCENTAGIKICQCYEYYRWNNTLCQSNPKCCGNTKCSVGTSVDAMCVLNTTVTITGSLKLLNQSYVDCLESIETPIYKRCRDDLMTKMKTVFSALRGFDYLNITGFRLGSIITDFVVSIASNIKSQVLTNISVNMTQYLQALLDMKTSGVVRLIMPKMPVPYEAANQEITCIATEDLKASPEWRLTSTNNITYDITNGTVSTVKILSATQSKLNINKVTDLWAGVYSCLYHQMKGTNYTINVFHQDSAKMDVALQPNIDAFTSPSFPRCTIEQPILEVTAICEIKSSSETYSVTWNGSSFKDPLTTESDGTLSFTVKKILNCNTWKGLDPEIVCTFQNRVGQTKNSSVPFNIIRVGDKYCQRESDWEDTKANFTAVLKCKNSAGTRQRNCDLTGNWGVEQNGCVNSNLYNVLQNAIISDIGLGLLYQNAANVFSSLHNVTKVSDTINTFANVNTSVEVLSTMSGKLNNISSQNTITDLLTSSSNLLEQSLGNSWTAQNSNSSIALAEKYLSSVEKLISKSNMTNNSLTSNIHVDICSEVPCLNIVFDVRVTVSASGNGIVKTTGFQNLQNYLPNTTNTSDINSIIVSTTTDNQTNFFDITLNFKLLEARPPDVLMECVSWDFNKNIWSPDGCKWGGASKFNVCTCSHLTSFAILMSKTPLEIPYITEITYAGLSVSVVSLVISLVIEVIVWSSVVKTNTLYLRHTAHINISLCLLVADCCFLASSKPEGISQIWCRISALLKHFCYLAMFFWMLSLSTTLLHQAVFLFHKVSKKTYLRFSLILGYVCPFLIVFVTFLTNNAGSEGSYFNEKTCWLVYSGLLKGTIYTFILPVGIIVFINLFSMVVVIMKLLDHKTTDKTHESEMRAAKTVLRSVILLTPIFGLPWIFGFATFSLDLTAGAVTLAVNYAFVLLNALQGFFILLTTCLGDKMTREALLNSCRKKKAPATISESSTKLETSKKT